MNMNINSCDILRSVLVRVVWPLHPAEAGGDGDLALGPLGPLLPRLLSVLGPAARRAAQPRGEGRAVLARAGRQLRGEGRAAAAADPGSVERVLYHRKHTSGPLLTICGLKVLPISTTDLQTIRIFT